MILSQIEPKKVVGTNFFNVNFLFLYPNIVPNIKLVVKFCCGGVQVPPWFGPYYISNYRSVVTYTTDSRAISVAV